MSTEAKAEQLKSARIRSAPASAAVVLFKVTALLFLFLIGVHVLGEGFKLLGRGLLEGFFRATSNPWIALMTGILATVLVQSSSVTTSMIVGLVAAPDNPLPIANAIPMVIGANIGTTVTNTLVSLGHITRLEEFRRAFAAAVCHDVFNFMTFAVLLPLDLATGYLRMAASTLSGLLGGMGGVNYESPLKAALAVGAAPFEILAQSIFNGPQRQGGVLIVCAAVLIPVALYTFVRVMRAAVRERAGRLLERVLGGSGVIAILVGIFITVLVQSSSITTSLLVPLAATGVITVRQAFPVTLGANIGTTVTALLASLAVSGVNAEAGLQIALVHLLFNLTGVALIFPFRRVRNIPVRVAQRLADRLAQSRVSAPVYVAGIFYGIPSLVLLINNL